MRFGCSRRYARQRRKRVLLVDTDMQANLTSSIVDDGNREPGIEALFDPAQDADPTTLVRHTVFPQIDIIPGIIGRPDSTCQIAIRGKGPSSICPSLSPCLPSKIPTTRSSSTARRGYRSSASRRSARVSALSSLLKQPTGVPRESSR